MHEYDVTLKRIITRPGSALLNALTGETGLRWLNVETPLVRNLRVDLLGQSAAGGLIHIELQSRNEHDFPLRMAEYLFALARRYGRVPRQVVLYVGEKPLRMKNHLHGPNYSVHIPMVDIRDIDGAVLLAGKNLSDNVSAVLTRFGEQPHSIRRILKRISSGPAAQRSEALTELAILAGLRRLRDDVAKEAKRMPILDNVIDDKVFGPLIEKGRIEGRAEGRAQGQVDLLLTQLAERFGSVSPAVRRRLAKLSPAELQSAARRLIHAQTVNDLFRA